MSSLWRRIWPLLCPILLVAVLAPLASSIGVEMNQVVIVGLIQLILVIGLYVFVGNSGVLSFGHMGFAAIGAYVGAIVVQTPENKRAFFLEMPSFLVNIHVSTPLSILIGGAAAAVVALVLAIPIMRLNGLTASLATFTILVITYTVVSHWETVTGGQAGMTGVPITTTRTTATLWGFGAMVLAYGFQRSAWGMRLQASREDEVAARAAGIDVTVARTIAWVLSAFITGVGGAVYGQFLGTFTPEAFYLSTAFVIVAMLVVGGLTSLAGAVVGTILLTFVAEVLQHFDEGFAVGPLHVPDLLGLSNLGLALIMLVILQVRPRGITDGKEFRWPSGGKRKVAHTRQPEEKAEDVPIG